MDEKFYDQLKEEAKNYFEKAGGHSFDHTERVLTNAIKISENADMDIVRASAILHDIAREKETKNKKLCHAQEGSKMCIEILQKLGFPEEKIPKVSYTIKVHRYSTGIKPETKEAEILQDADRLDALGAIVIGRVFYYAGKKGDVEYDSNDILDEEYISGKDHSAISHFYKKILKLKPDIFHTPKAKEIAKDRYDFVKEFIDRYIKEWNGEF
ncbi:MAG: HD domain-containing protein [Nanobdellota archaeon]